ncbi:hypothetical protein ACVTMO_18260 [Pseudomonas segetis]|uniref:hypothetical protein n=1 Tax=Pseudomonas segetis TaxID=298908 RepID=UPI001FEBDB17|nr:hypothetical protein [Pseudomonas segetis]
MKFISQLHTRCAAANGKHIFRSVTANSGMQQNSVFSARQHTPMMPRKKAGRKLNMGANASNKWARAPIQSKSAVFYRRSVWRTG